MLHIVQRQFGDLFFLGLPVTHRVIISSLLNRESINSHMTFFQSRRIASDCSWQFVRSSVSPHSAPLLRRPCIMYKYLFALITLAA